MISNETNYNQDWETKRIGDIGAFARGKSKHRPRDDKTLFGGEYPFIQTGDIKSANMKIEEYSTTYNDKGLSQSRLWKKGTLCITIAANIAETAVLGIDACFPDSIVGFTPNEDPLDAFFMHYMFTYLKARIQKSVSGSVQDNINLEYLKKLIIKIPALPQRIEIANTIKSLDDMIELNNRTNKILEEMAQAIFKRWFVDFEFPNEDGEPYKSNGGEMVDSELGEIPKGWRVVELGDVTTNIRERTKSNDYKVLSAVNTGDLKLSEEYFTKQVFSKDLSKYIIVRIKEFAYNPARVNIGSIGMNEYDFDGCVSPVYVVFKSEEDFHWFFKMFIKTKNFKSEVVKRASGSVRQSMNYSDFALIKIVYPPKGVIVKFNQFFETCYLAQREFTKEMEILSDIRDTLLPKLMSGEIRVPMEEVV